MFRISPLSSCGRRSTSLLWFITTVHSATEVRHRRRSDPLVDAPVILIKTWRATHVLLCNETASVELNRRWELNARQWSLLRNTQNSQNGLPYNRRSFWTRTSGVLWPTLSNTRIEAKLRLLPITPVLCQEGSHYSGKCPEHVFRYSTVPRLPVHICVPLMSTPTYQRTTGRHI